MHALRTRTLPSLAAAAALAVSVPLLTPSRAEACGGCFGPVESQQVVTDHRMVMAIHASEAILWDQFKYTGRPQDFSWVLPVTSDARIELASPTFFDRLDQMSTVQVRAPIVPNPCARFAAAGSVDSTQAPNAAADAGVTVLREEVVGPYQTVLLRAADPNALTTWLRSNNYAIPANIVPVIESYVSMHADFLALRLRPGEGVQSMQPVRVRYSAANMVLPLRMVAAGVAEKVGITLFVFGLGRHEAGNFGNGTVDPNAVIWDWASNTSNYRSVFTSTLNGIANGRAWITEFAQEAGNYQWNFRYPAPVYPDGGTSTDDPQADWNLATRNNTSGYWITRMRTDLLARFLDADLRLQPSTQSAAVNNVIQVADGHETGTRPVPNCPTDPYPGLGGAISGSGGRACQAMPGALGGSGAGTAGLAAAAGVLANVLRRLRRRAG